MEKIISIILIAAVLLVMPVHATNLDFAIAIEGTDASLRANSYTSCNTDGSRSRFDQHAYAYRSETLDYSMAGLIDNTNNIDIATNFTSVHSPASMISGVHFVENVASSIDPKYQNCSSCSSGIYANGGTNDIALSSLASTTEASLTHGYAIETNNLRNGITKAGFMKRSENTTVTNIYSVRGKHTFVSGLVECKRLPAGPVEEGKPCICPFGDDGTGVYPVFNGHTTNGNGNATIEQRARQEYVMSRIK